MHAVLMAMLKYIPLAGLHQSWLHTHSVQVYCEKSTLTHCPTLEVVLPYNADTPLEVYPLTEGLNT